MEHLLLWSKYQNIKRRSDEYILDKEEIEMSWYSPDKEAYPLTPLLFSLMLCWSYDVKQC